MDAVLDRSEDILSNTSTISTVPPTLAIVTPVSQLSEQQASFPVSVVDSSYLSTISLPGKTIENLSNDISSNKILGDEVASSDSLSAKTKDKENVEDSYIQLKLYYKYDQWSPLNPQGKKQYDRDFLLVLQSVPMSLCKPSNLPNISIIKDKPNEVKSNCLGLYGRDLDNWNQAGSRQNKSPVESKIKTTLTNRYDPNNQLPPSVKKIPSRSRKKINSKSKPIDVKRDENQLMDKMSKLTGPDYTEVDIDRKTKPLIDEFVRNADFEEAVKCIMELVTPFTVSFFINSAINQVLEKSSQARNLLGQLLYLLVKKELVTIDQYKEGLNAVLENVDDYAFYIPLIWEYIGEIIEPMILENKLPLTILKDLLEPCIPSEKAGKVVSVVLHCAAKKRSIIKLKEIWRKSGLQWSDFLDSSTNTTQFILNYNLGFTITSSSKVVQNTELTANEIKTQLKCFLKRTDEIQLIFNWINVNIPQSSIHEISFICALTTAVIEDALQKSKREFDVSKLRKRMPLLKHYIDNDKFELQTLYAVQKIISYLDYPKRILHQIFDTLYYNGVITRKIFMQWEKSKELNEQKGKNLALLQVRDFFTWLREAESASEDSEFEYDDCIV